MELNEKQNRWLFKGEFIELFEEFEKKRKVYKDLTNKLSNTKIGYHIPYFDMQNNSSAKTSERNTYPIINDLLFEINDICSQVEELEKKIDEMRVRYKELFHEDLTYSELVSRLTNIKK